MAEVVVDVKFADLKKAVTALNESKLLKENIKVVGIDKTTVLKSFMDAVAGIPDNAEGKFPGPPDVLNFYNAVCDAETKAKAKAGVATTEGTKETTTNKNEWYRVGHAPGTIG